MTTNQIRFDDGAAYERYMGKWSQLAGETFLDWLAPKSGFVILGQIVDFDYRHFLDSRSFTIRLLPRFDRTKAPLSLPSAGALQIVTKVPWCLCSNQRRTRS